MIINIKTITIIININYVIAVITKFIKIITKFPFIQNYFKFFFQYIYQVAFPRLTLQKIILPNLNCHLLIILFIFNELIHFNFPKFLLILKLKLQKKKLL